MKVNQKKGHLNNITIKFCKYNYTWNITTSDITRGMLYDSIIRLVYGWTSVV
jgi:hypothetical protein